MSVAAALLLSLSLSLHPEAGLRLYNPHDLPVEAALGCGGTSRSVEVAPHDAIDAEACAAPTLHAALPLVALETMEDRGVETQRLLGVNSGCETLAVEAPLFGCSGGTATVTLPLQQGATYAWSVDGASIVSGQGTNRLLLTLGEGAAARVRATVTGACAGAAEAVISIRNPLVIEKLEVPATVATNSAVTVRWSYPPGIAPASQLLTGDAFDVPVVLAADARSYSWTPTTAGVRNVELLASHGRSISTKPVGRRRAVGKTRATASECPSGRASAQIDVRGCGTRNPTISAPSSVQMGETFTASVFLRTGETAKWTAYNATIVSGANSDTVTIRAPELIDTLSLKVSVTTAPSCQAAADARIAITERAVCASSKPTVALSVESQSCNSAVVKATFTGTPPFRGTWADGTPFQTSAGTLTHTFNSPGTYTMHSFRDSLCDGTIAQTARVPAFLPTVTLTSTGNCPGSSVTAHFAGTPPFTGRWSDGSWFTTSEKSLTRTANASLSVDYLRDAACPNVLRESNTIQVEAPPRAWIRNTSECTISPVHTVVVNVYKGRPPYAVHWSDGVVSTGVSYEAPDGTVSIFRTLTLDAFEKRVSIARVSTGACDAIVSNGTAEVSYRPYPVIDSEKSTIVGCVGKPSKMVLKQTSLHPDAKITWSISNGEIVSGQGTRELTYIQWARPAAEVKVKATYPDRACDDFGDRTITYLNEPPRIEELSVEPSVILPGGTATFRRRISSDVEWASVKVQTTPKAREDAFGENKWVCTDIYGRDCTYTWIDKHGAGVVDMVLSVGNRCASEPVTARTTLRILAQP